MKHALLPALGLAALAVATPAYAQSAPVKPADVQAGAYAVEPGHTQVLFTVSHMGFTYYHGGFSGASGKLDIDPKKIAAAKLEVTVPIATVTTTSDKLTEELKSADWLDATQFPQATFTSTKVTSTGADSAKVEGDLTLHGVTKPVTFTAKFVGAGVNPLDKKYTVGFQVSGKFKRSDFGVKTYVPLIGDEVELTIAGAFERQD